MKKLAIATLIAATAAATLFYFGDTDNSREEYEAFLRAHPYVIELAKGKKPGQRKRLKDRPDLAFMQDFIRTMDPALRRPAPELLREQNIRTAMIRDRRRPHTASDGQATSLSTGTAWEERGPSVVGGRTRALLFDPADPTSKKVWAGGVSGGLWYLADITDPSAVWEKVDDFWDNLSISCIAADPHNNQIMYVGTGESQVGMRGAGVWKTSDGGDTWASLPNTATFLQIRDIAVRNENGTSVVYAAVDVSSGDDNPDHNQGLYRSPDGGLTWTQVLPVLAGNFNRAHTPTDIEFGDDEIWVGTMPTYGNASTNSIIYKSTTGLAGSWQVHGQATTGQIELAVAPSNPDVVYAMLEDNFVVAEIIRTENNGASWANVAEPEDADTGIPADDFSRGQAWYDLTAAVNPDNEDELIVGAIDLFKSTDGGQSWTQISKWWAGIGVSAPVVHADQHAILYRPGFSNQAIFGNDGGVYYASNLAAGTLSISVRNNSYNVTQFYTAALHPTETHYMLGGTQDNGTQQFTLSGFGSTTEVVGGDGGMCFIDQNDPHIQIASYVYNDISLSTDGGNSFSQLISDMSSGNFINIGEYDSDHKVLYTAKTTDDLYQVTNINTTPDINTLDISMGAMPSALRVSPHSADLYIGTDAGRLFRVGNAHTSNPDAPEEITGAAFPNGSISGISFGVDDNQILVTFFNYGVINIWETRDGGATWVNREGNLPNMPVRWVEYHPHNPDQAYIATQLGVWSTDNINVAAPEWLPTNGGLANVRTDMLRVRKSDGIMMASTYGRGVFSALVPSQLAQEITFDALVEKTYGDEPFELTAVSTSELLVNFTSSDPAIASVEGTTVTIHNAGTVTITAEQEGNIYFASADPVAHTLVINKAEQSVTFDEPGEKAVNDIPFELTATSTSDLTVTFSSSDPDIATIEGKVVTLTGAAGTTTITAHQVGDNNYLPATDVSHDLTVVSRVLEITGENDFGEVIVGEQKFLEFVLEDVGTGSVAITATDAPESFSAEIVTEGNNRAVVVGFAPTEEKDYTATITLITNATSGPQSIEVIGKGLLITNAEESASTYITVHPNPAREWVILSGPRIGKLREVNLYDGRGQKHVRPAEPQSENEVRVDVESLPTGTYIIAVPDEKRIRYKKLIIE